MTRYRSSEPREKIGPDRKFPQDPDQRTIAQRAAEQAGATTAAIRRSFIARPEPDPAGPVPPMARMLRGSGGRGGTTRLKLYLSLLWLARGRERPVFGYPAQQLAALLGLPAPGTAGARRVQDALRWLHEQNFVALDRRPGDVTRVHLLDDAGSGTVYRDPGSLTSPQSKLSRTEREQHFYVQLPSEYWTNGWITHLSGAATAMYLAALREERGPARAPVWISPRIGREQYNLSDETRTKGLKELVDNSLLALERRPVPQTAFDERYRARNIYRLIPDGLTNIHHSITRADRPPAADNLFAPSDRFQDLQVDD